MTKNIPLKLQIEMIPISSWGSNLRGNMPKSRWDKLRKQVHEQNGNKCEICGSTEKLHCHEHWEFDEATVTQSLVGLGTVCNMCHHVAHIGRSKQLASQGHLDLNAVVAHFLKINECDMNTFTQHEKEATNLFLERSKHDWKVDFGKYAELVNK